MQDLGQDLKGFHKPRAGPVEILVAVGDEDGAIPDCFQVIPPRLCFEQRKILDILLSNSTLAGGKVEVELKEVFQILADGVAEENELKSKRASKDARNEIWLPGLVSESAILRDLTALNWQRRRYGRITLAPTRVN